MTGGIEARAMDSSYTIPAPEPAPHRHHGTSTQIEVPADRALVRAEAQGTG